jgi:hypothetical protein
MGEQAIPAFQDRAEAGSYDGIDDLAAIATASAGLVLAELVGQPDSGIATRAAWHVARLVMYPDVEEALSRVPFDIRDQATMDWVWEPFESGGKSNLGRLMGRVAHLLWSSDDAQIPAEPVIVDPRIGIPVSMIRAAQESRSVTPLTREVDAGMTRLWSLLEVVQRGSAERVPVEMARVLSEVQPNLYEAALHESGLPVTIQRLLSILPWRLRVLGLVALLKADESAEMLTESNWRELRHGPPKLGRLAVAAGIATLVLMPIVLTGGIRAMLSSLGVWRWGPSWLSWVIVPCFLAWAVLSFSSRRLPRSRVARIGLAIVLRLSLLGTAWFVAATLAKLIGWSPAAALVGTTVGIAFALDYLYRTRLRASRNPLRAMLALHRRGLSGADLDGTGSSVEA